MKGYYYFCDEGTPHFEDWHYFGSRNWHQGDGSDWPPLGEREDVKQEWRNGSFPTIKPDAILLDVPIGGPAIAGVDIRCWRRPPPWGGLLGGGLGTFTIINRGGLLGGGRSRFVKTRGGLLGGGASHPGGLLGGLTGGGSSPAAATRGGFLGGGLAHSRAIAGGFFAGGLGLGRGDRGGLLGGGLGSFPETPVFIQSATAEGHSTGTVASASITWGAATTTGNNLIVVVAARSFAVPVITTPAGWQLAESQTNAGLSLITNVYYLENAASQSSTGNFTATSSSGPNTEITIAGAEYRNLKASASLDVAAGSTNAANPSTPSTGTLAQANELVACAFGCAPGATFSSPSAGYTLVAQINGGFGVAIAYCHKIVNSTSSTACAIQVGASTTASDICTFKGRT